jgi:16S rRNA (adenine1518-N6/adenine1519-N6)-dimethyltransferase
LRKFGQHFLIRGSILERIAAAACPEHEALVIEIGPGRGALTTHLLARADRVVAVEIDPGLTEYLRAKFASERRLELVRADVLHTDLAHWGPAVVAGNLPYYITSPILERALAGAVPFRRAVFLVQKEVADRITAEPGSRDYGYLTVMLRLFAAAEMLFTVKPGAFQPPPKVDSAVVRFTPAARASELGIDEPARFLRFVARAFGHKRKTLRNNLSETYGAGVSAWPEASLRAEQLTMEQFAELYRRLVP